MSKQTPDIVLDAALKCAEQHGLYAMTRRQIADAAGVAAGTVSYRFEDMAGMRAAVVRAAIERKCLPIIAAAVVQRHELAADIPAELKQAAMLETFEA